MKRKWIMQRLPEEQPRETNTNGEFIKMGDIDFGKNTRKIYIFIYLVGQ